MRLLRHPFHLIPTTSLLNRPTMDMPKQRIRTATSLVPASGYRCPASSMLSPSSPSPPTQISLSSPLFSDAIVEARKALTATGRAPSSEDGASVETHLLVAKEKLRSCRHGHFGSHTDERLVVLVSGEVTPDPSSPITMINELRRMSLISASSLHPYKSYRRHSWES
jgi:hypothetical protein